MTKRHLPSIPAWLDRDLRIVLLARTAMSAARAIAGVVTALYLAAEGFSAIRIGLLFLCVALASAVMSTTIGLVSDWVGRKLFLVVIPLLASAAACVFSADRATALLFVFAALGSFGRGAGAGAGTVGPYQPAEAAYVADRLSGNQRASAFGWLTFSSTLGALAGGLLSTLAQPGHSVGAAATLAYRPTFIAAAALSAIAGLVATALGEPKHRHTEEKPRSFRLPRRSWGILWRFWITNGMNGIAIGMFGPFVSYWFHRRFGSSPGQIGVLFAVINVATLAASLMAASIGKRFGAVRAIAAVRIFQGGLLIPMAFAPDFWSAGAIYLLRMLVQRVGLPLRQSFTQDVADPSERASVAAISNLPAQGTQSGSQVLAGYLFDQVALSAPMVIGGAIQALNGAAYLALFHSSGSKGQEAPGASQDEHAPREAQAPSAQSDVRTSGVPAGPSDHDGGSRDQGVASRTEGSR
ncbi:MAG: MFS transporter [Acidimicrobiales bacterium]